MGQLGGQMGQVRVQIGQLRSPMGHLAGNGTTFARSKTEGSKKKKSDTALEIVWICGEYMSEDYLGHFGPFR